jgi:hypothetical protein
MRGHVRERSAGRWAIVIDLRDATSGKRRRKWHSFKGTKRGAQEKCAALIAELKSGAYVEATKEAVLHAHIACGRPKSCCASGRG